MALLARQRREAAALAGEVRLSGDLSDASVCLEPGLERLLAAASGVVAMGGYNTFCEILSMDKPATPARSSSV